ncbi:hypothetical protein NPIL_273321 [Nephila pilipes]|uniref:Uncharacterized protein n=1 Tax=Nephila pilipes TaxID=299642 RepID=A0A8X6TIY8_NEPPI|nr:hypothetical protein NPIL_273321 [Nephila pilipes]
MQGTNTATSQQARQKGSATVVSLPIPENTCLSTMHRRESSSVATTPKCKLLSLPASSSNSKSAWGKNNAVMLAAGDGRMSAIT